LAWPVYPQGYDYDRSLRLPAREQRKFGYLYLNGGRWDGNQLIRADYVAAATSPKGSTNLDNLYGWHWLVAYARDDRTFFARATAAS
jgi:CubicO group peptidase (beta-lactamase class C family)